MARDRDIPKYDLSMQKELRDRAPDSFIEPSWFAVSITDKALLVTTVLGPDLRFARGVQAFIGVSALRELTVNMTPAENNDRFRTPKYPDPYLNLPGATIEIALSRVQLVGLDRAPVFTRKRIEKVFVQRSEGILLTTSLIIPKP